MMPLLIAKSVENTFVRQVQSHTLLQVSRSSSVLKMGDPPYRIALLHLAELLITR